MKKTKTKPVSYDEIMKHGTNPLQKYLKKDEEEKNEKKDKEKNIEDTR